jgi:hypothetical protein
MVLPLCFLLLMSGPAWAGTVNHAADDGADGSLRFELDNAVSGETVTINPGINPVITGPVILIDEDVTLAGQGQSQTTITGSPTARVFLITHTPTETVTIRDLTITGGNAPDGSNGVGAGADGEPGGNGGAIALFPARLLVERVRFTANHAGDGGDGQTGTDGGGVSNGGLGGDGGNGGGGGAIWVEPSGSLLTVVDSTFENNTGGAGGDAGNGGNGSSHAAGQGGDGAPGGPGGAIDSEAAAAIQVSGSTFSFNSGGNSGSGGDTGSLGTPGFGGSGGQAGAGGAIMAQSATISSSTFNTNHAGHGGAAGTGAASGFWGDGGPGGAAFLNTGSVANSTFTGNFAGSAASDPSGNGSGGDGGGLRGLSLSVTHSTISGNSSGNGSTPSFPGLGGGLRISGTLANSIIAGNLIANTNGLSPAANCTLSMTTVATNNLTNPTGTGCTGATIGDPLLGPLASNGGQTQTMALSSGSPAIDLVPSGAGCLGTDQRGVSRPQGAACDAGAFELESTATAPLATPPAQAQQNCKKLRKKKQRKACLCKQKKGKQKCRKKKRR